jgi:peptide chain release factor subunit 1
LDFFEALQLEAPLEQNALYINDRPNLYPLAKLNDQYPRYAVLLADTNSARIFVYALRKLERQEEVQNVKTRGTSMGGWSQARYQRHNENYHLHHAKEVIDTLERIVRSEGIDKVMLSGDEVILPILKEQMPQHLRDKIIDILRLDIRTPEHEILTASLARLQEKDAETDAAKVERLLDEYRSGGLGVVGTADTLAALGIGQVDELIITARPAALDEEAVLEAATSNHMTPPEKSGAELTDETAKEIAADALVTAAKQTGAKVTFIENPELLAEVGGVGALLRYRV